MHAIKAVLFDLDGTLINSINHIVDCWQHTVRTGLGWEISREDVLPTLGKSLYACLDELAPGRSAELYEIYSTYEGARQSTAIKLVEGTREALDALAAHGLALGVVTSKGIKVALEGLNLFGLVPYFPVLVTHEQTERHKPFPDPLLYGCMALGLPPSEVLYVGDAVVDIIAGKAAGMPVAAVTWGVGDLAALAASEPDYTFNSMSALAEAALSAKSLLENREVCAQIRGAGGEAP